MTDEERGRFDERLTIAKRIGYTRWNEQCRIGDRIEQLIYEAKNAEACEVLVALAQHVYNGTKP